MSKYVFLGDVHGDTERCVEVCEASPDALVVQVGDLGVGFLQFPLEHDMGKHKNFRGFCGNHDNRQAYHKLPFHLGDYGAHKDFFFVSGADSIDKARRVPGVSWWEDEQLSQRQLQDAIDQWVSSNLQILVAHDAPQDLPIASHHHDRTRTRMALQEMVNARPPKLFIYGHHHVPNRPVVKGTQYWGLGIGETVTVEVHPGVIKVNGGIKIPTYTPLWLPEEYK